MDEVNISLAAANSRRTREDRDQFEEANTKIVTHLETKEDELSKSIASCKVEADVLHTWINFLEDTWVLKCSYAETKEKQVNDELEKHEHYFVNFAIDLLSAYKKELGPSISRIGKFVENLKNLSKKSGVVSNAENEDSKALNPLRSLEEEYLDHETKECFRLWYCEAPNSCWGTFVVIDMHTLIFVILFQIITTFSVVGNMKAHFYSEQTRTSRPKGTVKELFDDIEKLRAQFEAVERPILEIETPTPQAETPSDYTLQSAPSDLSADGSVAQKDETVKHSEKGAVKVEQVLDPEDDLAKLESEFGKVGQDYSTEEVGEWEFDELERELISGDSSTQIDL
ncbi:uncharacterized protein LOC121048829 [Rosa chinensis]|uniref:uncharacterized protein LOC121048829 n=1 Tax=Rosa chinensis TaxID=74649 RepID=UPI001AD8A906|nr:uncharacterized protein LOC121048829 [Rosa chinensis]